MRNEAKTLIRTCKLVVVIFCGILTTNTAFANFQPTIEAQLTSIDSVESKTDLIEMPSENIAEQFATELDAMVSNLLTQSIISIDSTYSPDSLPLSLLNGFFEPFNPELTRGLLPDSVYIRRLQGIDSFIDLPFNETVQNGIHLYTERKRAKTEIMLGLAQYYFPLFEEALSRYGLPEELKYMAVIESALNPKALSHAGASGLWQFMYGTGKLYGLEVNTYVDERRDPIKATDAAARYLKTLYGIYGDWHLVIAAYNCGPGNVNKAIARSGGKRDYWSIYYRLPKETRSYVPLFIAASYVMNYYSYHNLAPQKISFPLVTDTVMVNNYLNLKQVSEYMGINLTVLRDLNPMYKIDVIPAKPDKKYPLCLPQEYVMGFLSNQDSVLAFNRNDFFPNNSIKVPSQNLASQKPINIRGKDKVSYTVKPGDNIGFIASWFDVPVNELKDWNNINRNFIKAGQKLVIYVPSGKSDYYQAFNNLTIEEKNAAIGKTPPTSNLAVATTQEQVAPTVKIENTPRIKSEQFAEADYEIYTVRKGDNLWVIAKRYPGVTAENIKYLNNIKNPRDLYIGQKLKIQPKG